MTNVGINILIAGYYGFYNTGDEAILKSMIDRFRSERKDLTLTVVSGNPNKTSSDYNVVSVHWQDVPAISDAVKRCDLVILGGGGLFHDAYDSWDNPVEDILTPRHKGINYFSCFPILALLHEKPLVLFSLGVGPLITDHGKKLTQLAFENANLASVRDGLSRELLGSLGIDIENVLISPDPAFGLQPAFDGGNTMLSKLTGENISGPVLGVCLRHWEYEVSPLDWQEKVAKALDIFISTTRCKVVFLPFQNPPELNSSNDLLTARRIIKKMQYAKNVHLLSNAASPGLIAGIIAQCDVILGMRLHSLIFSIKAGVPAVALSYDEKVDQLMGHFEMKDYLLSIKDLSAQGLAATLQRAIQNSDEIKKRLLPQSQSMQRGFSKFSRAVLSILEDGPSPKNQPEFEKFVRELSIMKFNRLASFESSPKSMLQRLLSRLRRLKKIRDDIIHGH